MPELIDLIDFEDRWPRWSGRKDEAIRAWFRLTPARYFQMLNRAIDNPSIEAERPQIVHRLRRLRDARRSEQQRRHGVAIPA